MRSLAVADKLSATAQRRRLTTLATQLDGDAATGGDVADIDIACYAPYVSVTALDRPTAHRMRETKLPCAARTTGKLSEVPDLLRRVADGELTPVPSA